MIFPAVDSTAIPMWIPHFLTDCKKKDISASFGSILPKLGEKILETLLKLDWEFEYFSSETWHLSRNILN